MNESNGNIKFLSAISYIFVLFILGHFALEKNNPDLRFHKIQGFVLFCFSAFMYLTDYLIYLMLAGIPELQFIITFLLTIGITVGYLMLVCMGIAAALRFEQRILPFIGNAAVLLREKLDEKSKSH